MKYKFYILLALLIVLTSCAKFDYENIYVTKVIDGDTLRLASGEDLRLIGIDSPEMFESNKLYRDAQNSGEDIRQIIAKGKRSWKFMEQLAQSKTIRLEFDEERYDKYGRLLAYAFLPDGTFINAQIVKEGYAKPYIIKPNVRYADLFYQLYWEAQKNKKGLWE